MKMKKLISLFLAFAMLMSISSTAFAAENQTTAPEMEVVAELDETAVEDAVRELYESLTPEAKEVFAHAISGDADLVAYFQETVDESFVPVQNVMPFAVTVDPLVGLRQDLIMMGLPAEVITALMATGSGIVAAVGDGVLLVGDAYLLITTASLAVVLAANWTIVEPLWPDVVAAFQRAFVSSTAAIAEAFRSLNAMTVQQYTVSDTRPIKDRQDKTVTYNRVTYKCTTRLSAMTDNQKKSGHYYVTYKIGTMLYMDVSRPVSLAVAKTILSCNDSTVGISTSTSLLALEAASPIDRADDPHKDEIGYLPHYHPDWAKLAHCWYFFE